MLECRECGWVGQDEAGVARCRACGGNHLRAADALVVRGPDGEAVGIRGEAWFSGLGEALAGMVTLALACESGGGGA